MKNFSQIPNEVLRNNELSLVSYRILTLLYSFHPCYPSYIKIMQLTGIRSKATIRKGLKELKENNYISIKQGSSFRGANEYAILNSTANLKFGTDSKPSMVQNLNSNNTNKNIEPCAVDHRQKPSNQTSQFFPDFGNPLFQAAFGDEAATVAEQTKRRITRRNK